MKDFKKEIEEIIDKILVSPVIGIAIGWGDGKISFEEREKLIKEYLEKTVTQMMMKIDDNKLKEAK